jgi:hypothetical protein
VGQFCEDFAAGDLGGRYPTAVVHTSVAVLTKGVDVGGVLLQHAGTAVRVTSPPGNGKISIRVPKAAHPAVSGVE